MFKNLFIFMGGMAAGVFVCWRAFESYAERCIDEELEAVETYLDKSDGNKYEKQAREYAKAAVGEDIPEDIRQDDGKVSYNRIPQKPSLDELVRGVQNEVESDIYVISHDEFNDDTNEEASWEKTTLIFYTGDGILTDEEGAVIGGDFIHKIIGVQGHNLIQESRGQNDVTEIYVRNHPREADYEIVIEDRAYEDHIRGIYPDQSDEDHEWKGKGFKDERNE